MNFVHLFVLCIGMAYSTRLPPPPTFSGSITYPSICYLPPDSGLCPDNKVSDDSEESTDLLTRYYFDMATESCYPFGVQGCGGNENRFPSKETCETYCQVVTKP